MLVWDPQTRKIVSPQLRGSDLGCVPGRGVRSSGSRLSRETAHRPPPPPAAPVPVAHCHSGTVAHCHIGTLSHCHISTLAHCHISTFSHVHRSKMDEIRKISRNRSPCLRLTRECATSTPTGLIKPMGCLPGPKTKMGGGLGTGAPLWGPPIAAG